MKKLAHFPLDRDRERFFDLKPGESLSALQLLTLEIIHGMEVGNARAIVIARARAQRERKNKKVGIAAGFILGVFIVRTL